MKHLIIICEGQTECEFCKTLLSNHLLNKGISSSFVLPKKTGGGIASWDAICGQIKQHLHSTCYVTTLFDYYGLTKTFPNFDLAQQTTSKIDTVEIIEQGMIDKVGNDRFIPYLQLHEFETLLFCELEPFVHRFDLNDAMICAIEKIIADYPNPEDINNGLQTAPSKRLIKIISKYNKVIDGKALASSLGLAKIRAKCPHFNAWVNKIENIR